MDEQTVYTAESPIQTPENRQDAVRYAPVSTGAFFGYKILYGIPVIGWILCIVFSFTQKNVNKRNFARATLIGMIISLVLTCLLAVAVVKVAEVVIEQVAMEALGGSLEELGPVKDVLDELKDGKYDEMISRVEDGEFGDHPELSGMLEELKDGGVLGVVAGIALSRLISAVMGTPTAVSPGATVIALVFSTVIGVLFGLLPAIKAANLNPIDALRRE